MALNKNGSALSGGIADKKTGKNKRETFLYIGFVLLAFGLTFAWSLIAEPPAGPDEHMRLMIPQYIYEHGHLPNGYDPEVRNALWGFSYAFFPMLSYMISAFFMKVVSIFTTANRALICAARFTDVLFITATAALVPKITERLFHDSRRWMMNCLIVFLPELIYAGTYVNHDPLAIFTTTVIIYAWTRYLDEGWTRKNCIILAAGMGFCLLSYYNAYGWILMSFFLFIASNLLDDDGGTMKERSILMVKKGLLITAIVVVIAGWFFVRNAILYDGDIFGLESCKICGEMYAVDELKPSLHWTPERAGMSWKDMLFYQVGGWPHNWLIMSIYSFICAFGYYNIFMEEWMYKIYFFFILFGFVFALIPFRKNFSWKTRKGKYNSFMGIGMLIPPFLLFYYSFYSDLQAQGRYMISSTIAVMYFVTLGYGWFLEKLPIKENTRNWFYRSVAVLWTVNTFVSYFRLVLPTAGWSF